MDKLFDLELEESGAGGLFSKADTEDIALLDRSRAILEFNLLCSKLCFPNYRQPMSQNER